MSSLEKLGEQLALVLTKLAEARTALTQARNRIGESGQVLAAVVDDDTHPDLLAGISAYREVWSTTTEVGTTITALDEVLRAYMTSIGAPGAETAGIPDDVEASPPMVATPSSENTAQPNQSHEPPSSAAPSGWLLSVHASRPRTTTVRPGLSPSIITVTKSRRYQALPSRNSVTPPRTS